MEDTACAAKALANTFSSIVFRHLGAALTRCRQNGLKRFWNSQGSNSEHSTRERATHKCSRVPVGLAGQQHLCSWRQRAIWSLGQSPKHHKRGWRFSPDPRTSWSGVFELARLQSESHAETYTRPLKCSVRCVGTFSAWKRMMATSSWQHASLMCGLCSQGLRFGMAAGTQVLAASPLSVVVIEVSGHHGGHSTRIC